MKQTSEARKKAVLNVVLTALGCNLTPTLSGQERVRSIRALGVFFAIADAAKRRCLLIAAATSFIASLA